VQVLIGFGHPLVTALWALVLVALAGWFVLQLLQKRPVTFLSNLLFFSFLLPVVLQYPFTFSPLNGLTIGPDSYVNYPPQIDSAFLITLAGVAALLAGYAAAGRRSSRLLVFTLVSSGLRVWSQSSFLQVTSGFMLLLFGILASVGLLGTEGARNLAQAQPALRPLYNIVHVLLPITIGLCLLVGLRTRRRTIVFLAIANTGLAALTGARAVALGGLLLYIVTLLTHRSLLRELRVGQTLKLVPLAGALLLLAVYLGDVREGQYNLLRTGATLGFRLFYGNNFSDLRDFAWVKSYWDGQYFLGWTQAAGLLAFIPSALSPFRAEWNLGVVTTTLVGQDPLVNPGLRVGLFGESFFNFGIPGVLLAGFLYGYFVRRVHNICLLGARTSPAYPAQFKVFSGLMTISLATGLLNTAGFYGLYVTIAVLLGLQVLDYMIRVLRAPRSGPLRSGRVATAPAPPA
jgi:hypothetical protein